MVTRHTSLFLVCASSLLLLLVGVFFAWQHVYANATKVHQYSDLLTDSATGQNSNHTFSFVPKSSIAAGGYLDFDFPAGFELISTSTFDIRNVELLVNGVSRSAAATQSAANDQVIITTGDGGSIRYNLNTTTGIAADSNVVFRIGNHTTNSQSFSINYSTSTGTTTTPADIEPITNPSTSGNQYINMTVGGSSETMYANFLVVITNQIRVDGVDTTEEIPPYRFNGAPDGEIGGTTLNVEISVETDEFSICKYSQNASTSFAAMNNTFESTGLIIHTQLVAVVPETLNTYYVRCIDDEDNFNTDDYIVSFIAPGPPSGTANTDGDVEGDGTGSGNDGTGSGTGGGGSSSGSGGSGSSGGSSSGSGGSGGGSGGSSGPDSPDNSGGGFESGNNPYPSGDAEIIINGYAFPGSTVYGLVDGSVIRSRTADSNGKFSITLEEIARGAYTFGVYAIDENDIKSSTFSTSFTVTGGKTSNLSNVNLAPTVDATPDPVDVGGAFTLRGFAIPNSTVTIENQKDKSAQSLKSFTTTSDSDGEWSLSVDTSLFSNGTYKARAKSEQTSGVGVKTSYSEYTYYGVGGVAEGPLNADLNTDGKVNLTDFSILLFWWGSDSSIADINGDGNVSLTDFSILLFNWTG